MLLSDFGAEVVKVERPGGDRTRGTPAFRVLNRGKRGVVLDPGDPEASARWRQVLAGADVVVAGGSNLSRSLGGDDPETLLEVNPGLILVHAPMYGTDGPLAGVPEDEGLLAALSGLSCHQVTYEPGPAYFPTPVAGSAHGILIAVAVAAGLWAREHTGAGQLIKVSGISCCHEYELGGFIFSDQLPAISPRVRMLPPRLIFATYGYFAGSDDHWFFVGALTAAQWVRLAEELGRSDLLIDERFVDGPMLIGDPAAFRFLHVELEHEFATAPRQHWLDTLSRVDVPVAPVNHRSDFLSEDQVRHLGLAVTIDDPEVGPIEQIGLPIFFDGAPGRIRGGAPPLDPAAPWPDWSPQAKRPPMRRVGEAGPLSGVRVLDVGAFLAGPVAATVLADLGADVVKVEPPTGDPWRAMALGFLGWNRGKRSVVLDLKREVDRLRLDELVKWADVVVDNNRPDVSASIGLSPAHLAVVNPRIVSVSVTANGMSGPMSGAPAYDQVFQARSGLSHQQAGGGEPIILSIAPNDHSAGALGAFAAVAALYARCRTGAGEHADTSLLQAAMIVGAGDLAAFPGRPARAMGGRDRWGRSASDRAYRCADGRWVYLQVHGAPHWEALVRALSHPELEARPWESAEREGYDGQLAAILADQFERRPRDVTVEHLLNAGVPCVPCLDVDEVLDHPHTAANAPAVEFSHPRFGTVRLPGPFATFTGAPTTIAGLAPDLGRHTDEVLQAVSIQPDEARDHGLPV
jgi:crotonobetainyl-CoA:carnitine CoA-transferase CaiB-like acyl-CoA transferase